MQTEPKETPPESKSTGCAWLFGIIVVIAVLASLTDKKPSEDPSAVLQEQDRNEAGVAEKTTQEPSVDDTMLKTAARHASIAIAADGIQGAEAYSTNCWAATERKVTLDSIERCVAFDTMVAMALPSETPSQPWFSEDVVNVRYLTALESNGIKLASSSARLERLRVAAAVQTVDPTRYRPKAAEVEQEPMDVINEADFNEDMRNQLASDL